MPRKVTPFSISPNPVSLYLTDALEAALFKIRYCVDYRQGVTTILGDVGVGKSSLVRYAHAELDAREDITSILIPTPNFKTDYAFIQAIAQAVGLQSRRSVQQHERELEAWLAEQYLADRAVVLFVDEAQKLSTKMLELVRSFLNYETNEAKLIQIILAGQLELRDRLQTKKMKALFSRLIAPTVLSPMSLAEVEKMIEHRCAYYRVETPFPAPAMLRVYELSGGIPRDVLRICGTAYQMLQLMGVTEAPVELIDQAFKELQLSDESDEQS